MKSVGNLYQALR